MPVHSTDLAKLGLHFANEQEALNRVEGQNIDETAPSAGTDLDLDRDEITGPRKTARDGRDATGMCLIPDRRLLDPGRDQTQLGLHAERAKDAARCSE
ncbi:MAG: hypothetical protein V4515_08975 [Chloroflexota bacterium]